MIVARVFDSDDDAWTMLVQHDAYPSALAVILEACRAYGRLAIGLSVADDPILTRFLAQGSIDHRTIQPAHDLIAAWWRYRARMLHPTLPFKPEDDLARERREAWLEWLDGEVADWIYEPSLVRALIVAATSDEAEMGKAADAAVLAILNQRFAAMYEPYRTGVDRNMR